MISLTELELRAWYMNIVCIFRRKSILFPDLTNGKGNTVEYVGNLSSVRVSMAAILQNITITIPRHSWHVEVWRYSEIKAPNRQRDPSAPRGRKIGRLTKTEKDFGPRDTKSVRVGEILPLRNSK